MVPVVEETGRGGTAGAYLYVEDVEYEFRVYREARYESVKREP